MEYPGKNFANPPGIIQTLKRQRKITIFLHHSIIDTCISWVCQGVFVFLWLIVFLYDSKYENNCLNSCFMILFAHKNCNLYELYSQCNPSVKVCKPCTCRRFVLLLNFGDFIVIILLGLIIIYYLAIVYIFVY